MASNALSSRRYVHRRPIVCKPPPPPPPGTEVTLYFIPDELILEPDASEGVELKMCNTAVPQGEEVIYEWDEQGGTVEGLDDMLNCETISFDFNADGEPGYYVTKLTVKWSDQTVAIAFLPITILEDEEED